MKEEQELQDLQIFSVLKKIPYENVSKIHRLVKPKLERPREPKTVLSEHLENKYGGTCFSLVNLLVNALKMEGIKAYPVKADIHRRTFPHFFCIISYQSELYLVDPGYLINDPVLLTGESIPSHPNSPINFEITMNEKGKYTLKTIAGGVKKDRYSFSIQPVDDDEFMLYWTKSFDYIKDIVASMTINNKFIYINGDYVQVRSEGNVEKYNSEEKALEYLRVYFNLEKEYVQEAKRILNLKK